MNRGNKEDPLSKKAVNRFEHRKKKKTNNQKGVGGDSLTAVALHFCKRKTECHVGFCYVIRTKAWLSDFFFFSLLFSL